MMTTLADESAALEKQALERDHTTDATALPDFASACRALLYRFREVRRIVEALTTVARENAENKDAKKELRAQRQRAEDAWTRGAAEGRRA